MATLYARPGEKTYFAGGANELECILADDTKTPIQAPSMVQISSQGALLNAVTISTRGFGTTTYDVAAFTEAKSVALLGESGNKIAAAKVGGLAAGDYYFTFIATP